MLLLERDPLVRDSDLLRDSSFSDSLAGAGGLPAHAPRRATLLLWVAVVGLNHFDRGAATVAAMDVALAGHGGPTSAQLSFTRIVAPLAWHSIGLALGSVLAGAAFQRASAKAVLLLALVVNATALSVLSLLSEVGWLATMVLRLASGLAASFPLVYLPLWVDEFSPTGANGRWMAIVQMGTPLGQFLGVLVAGLMCFGASNHSGLHWRSALLAQVLLLVPATLQLLMIPASQIDVANISSLSARLDSLTLYPGEGPPLGHLRGLFRETREMLQGVSRNPLTVSVTISLCLLHSTGAGLAIWAGPYLALSEGAPPPLAALLLAGAMLVVLPACGTCTGAVLCDRLHGFKAGHHAAALRVASGFVALAALAGPVSGPTVALLGRLGALSLWLFGAGAFLPISVGVLMTSMPSYLRSFSSTSSLLVFHVVGFAFAPCALALLMSCFIYPDEGLGFGVDVTLWITSAAAVLLLIAYTREPKCAVPAGLAGVDDLTFSDISYELARRRMTTAPL